MLAMSVKVTAYEKDSLKGLATVSINQGDLELHGIRIMESKQGKLFVSFPSYQNKGGEYVQYFNPVTAEFRSQFEQKVMDAYEAAKNGTELTEESVTEPTNLTDVRVSSYEKDNIKGLATIVLNNSLAIHSIKVVDGKFGLYPQMPSRKASDGTYHDIVELSSATKKMVRDSINEKLREKTEKKPEEKGQDKDAETEKPKRKPAKGKNR